MPSAASPYKGLPDTSFWKRAVAISPDLVDPVIATKFAIGCDDKVATAGSCFAQHIARSLDKSGYNYFVSETGDEQRNYGVFSCRFGNIYTCRQLLQLFRRAYGLYRPGIDIWRRANDGAYVDAFRPQVEPAGFAIGQDLLADRTAHLGAVRKMFEQCDVFIFTLGLTESWESVRDGAVYPLAPGVAGAPEVDAESSEIVFRNFTTAEMIDDLKSFIKLFRRVNTKAKIILTVSPVPLIATYETRHVLVSNMLSKSSLRVVADAVAKDDDAVDYFPSYEIVTGPHHKYSFFAEDMRTILPEGVQTVMRIFSKHYLAEAAPAQPVAKAQPKRLDESAAPVGRGDDAAKRAEMEALYRVVCDEEAIES